MASEPIEGEMIEIGDPSEETPVADLPTRVVIEYRERGVPWMLIPPMLVLSAVGALMAYIKLAPPTTTIHVAARPAPIAMGPAIVEESSKPPASAPTSPESPAPVATPIELSPAVMPNPSSASEKPPVEDFLPPTPPQDPVIRDRGVGFDPRVIEQAKEQSAPADDPSVAPASGPPGVADQPGTTPDPEKAEPMPDKPEEVDASLLPVDPKEARRRREQRTIEARRKAEAARGQFHVELKAALGLGRKSVNNAVQAINELCKKHGMEVDPAVQSDAARLLGGPAAGASREVRINLLRSAGFPEQVILHDLFDVQKTFYSKAARGGPKTEEDVMYLSARLLLQYPPKRVASPSRAVSTTRPAR